MKWIPGSRYARPGMTRRSNNNENTPFDLTGKVVIEPQYDTAGEFRDGRAIVRIESQYGLIDPAGKVRWRFPTNDRSWSTPAIAEDGTIYIGSDDDHLYAVSGDGKQKWALHLGDCDPKGFGPELSAFCDFSASLHSISAHLIFSRFYS